MSRLIDSSTASATLDDDALEAILDRSRASKAAAAITGVLILADGVFVQVLEGEADALDALVERIERDPRHHGLRALRVLHREPTGERLFDAWSMAHLAASRARFSTWAGLAGTEPVETVLARLRENPERVPGVLMGIVSTLAET